MFTVADYSLVGDEYLLPRKLKSPLLTRKKAMVIVNQTHAKKLQCIWQKQGKVFHFHLKTAQKSLETQALNE